MKNKKSGILVLVLLLLLVGAALLCRSLFAPQGREGEKNITVTITHGDGSEKEFAIETDEQTLRAALEEHDLIAGEESEYGLFVTTVDGETVDAAKEQWWCFTQSGEMLMTGVDETMIADGDVYGIAFTEGYAF